MAGVLLVLSVVNGKDDADCGDSCRRTLDNVLLSCRAQARSDYWLALAKCENLADPAERKACRKQASADLKEALELCKDQRDARKAVCRRLGGAPYDPEIDPSDFVATIDNPFFPLSPGTTYIYEGQTAEGLERAEKAVTHNTMVILGVTCVEVHDVVTLDGEVIEDTLDWFAQDKDGNVWYFGENSKRMADGLVVDLAGSWTAGEDGAKPGIIMKAHPAVGNIYRQEFALEVAEDLGEVLSLNAPVTVPAGTFDHCVKTKDFTPLEPEVLEHKFYAPGVGFVLAIHPDTGEKLELIQVTEE